jgi:hypothetical protein
VPSAGRRLSLRLDDPNDFAALNLLLETGVRVRWHADGTVSIPAGARRQARIAAQRYGVTWRVTTPARRPAARRPRRRRRSCAR